MTRHRLAALAAALLLIAPATAGAGTTRGDTERWSESYSGSVDCGTFGIEYSGVGHFAETALLDDNGEPAGYIVHARLEETNTNTVTGKSLVLRQRATDRINGTTGLRTITGPVWIGTERGAGTFVRDVGRIVLDLESGEVLFRAGPKEVKDAGSLDTVMCEALA